MPKLKEIKVKLDLPYVGGIEGTWEPNNDEKKAAWEMYVELVTRISVAELQPDEGSLREALTSLYSLFSTTRQILRQYGPNVAQPKGGNSLSFGYLAVVVLNTVLRPLLAKWHPKLKAYEEKRPSNVSQVTFEQQWEDYDELRRELDKVRKPLIEYADLLAQVAGVPSLIVDRTESVM